MAQLTRVCHWDDIGLPASLAEAQAVDCMCSVVGSNASGVEDVALDVS
jgi:hypothetical protein